MSEFGSTLGADDRRKVDDFKAAFRNHPAGVAIITADSGGGPVGLTATSVCSVSVNPPLLMFSLSAQSSATPGLQKAETLVVHIIGAGEVGLAKTFATSGIDRFADKGTWARLPTGEPFLPRAKAWLRGKVVSTMNAGDSTVVAVQVVQVGLPRAAGDETDDTRPLVFVDRTWHALGPASCLS